MDDERQAVVRNGYLTERTVLTGIGDATVKVPKLRGRSGGKPASITLCCRPYLKRARSVEELIPWRYRVNMTLEAFGHLSC